MNRYELHEKLKEAEKKGYQRGRDETLLQAASASRATTHAFGHPTPAADPSLTGKYRCHVEWSQMPNHAAYELRATLVVGRKYYNAKQTVPYDTWDQLRSERESFKGYLNRWLDGAYVAMWKEFKKDVLFEFPNLDAEARTPQPRPGFFANLAGLRDPVPTLARPVEQNFRVEDHW